MASQSKHYDKRTGAVYVYSVESYWDKDKKAPRNRQTCLGRLDEKTGAIIPSRRSSKADKGNLADVVPAFTMRISGPNILLSKVDADLGVGKLLERCFPDIHGEMLSLVYFIVQKGLPLSRCEFWSENHQHPHGERMPSQRVSELLLEITADARQRFLSHWASRMAENDFLCYDITSISSYAANNEYVRRGYNRDGEPLPQINLAMLFGQKCRLPACYRRLQGNIGDVSTLQTTLKTLECFGLELKNIKFVMDRGFYSKANIDSLLRQRMHFIIAVPTGRKWVENIIDQYYENVELPKYYRMTGENEALFMASHLYSWGEEKRRCYLHLYYNAQRAADDFDRLSRLLIQCKSELDLDRRAGVHQELYDRFFIVRETPKRGRKVEYNDAEIQRYRKRYAGFFCLFSTNLKDPLEVLNIYRAKDVVENSFDDLKNQLDMKRLRVHSSASMDSRLFLQFIALIFICGIRTVIQSQTDPDLKYLTVREAMEAMESLASLSCSGRYGNILSEMNPIQRKIVTAFSINIPQP